MRDENLQTLNAKGYGIEELGNGRLDLYNDHTYLFVDQFKNHEELSEWIKENIKEVR